MTRRIVTNLNADELPVEFITYRLATKDIIIVDDEGKPKTIAKQGEPNPYSYTSFVFYRLVSQGETVGDTIKRFKKHIEGSGLRYHVKWAPETNAEFKARIAADENLEIVTDLPIIEQAQAA